MPLGYFSNASVVIILFLNMKFHIIVIKLVTLFYLTNVQHERIVEVCDLLEKVSFRLQEKLSIFELKKTQQCKKVDENVDDHICEFLDCCFKVYYDEVDIL